MAHHAPISNVATTTGLSSTFLGVYLHVAWQILLIMSTASLALIVVGHVKLMQGKRALAKQNELYVMPKSTKSKDKNIKLKKSNSNFSRLTLAIKHS